MMLTPPLMIAMPLLLFSARCYAAMILMLLYYVADGEIQARAITIDVLLRRCATLDAA